MDREGELLRDYQTARKDKKTAYVTYRYYLSDGVFLVGLESGDKDLLSRLDHALRNPAFPLFLGRRSCPPTPPLSLGVRESDLLTALRETPRLVSGGKTDRPLRLVTDGVPGEPSAGLLRDLPVSFDPTFRRFAYRAVTDKGVVCPPGETVGTEHDPMSELGGESE